VLGIHARSEAERQRYAERWVQSMIEYARQSLAWQRAYHDAAKRLGAASRVDTRQPPALPNAFQVGDRLLFFARDDCPPCDTLLPKLLSALERHPLLGIDLYLLDTARGDDERVRAWAKAHGIPPALVQARRITLNHDNGLLAQLIEKPEVPTLLRRRKDALTALTPSSLEQ
jgi:integrating conjugative element protein (TIGR03759 family)